MSFKKSLEINATLVEQENSIEQNLFKIPKSKLNFMKLKVNQNYLINIQYYDETLQDPYFYVNVQDNFSVLELLDQKLQQEINDKTKFFYVNELSELSCDMLLEALYDLDSKWYRVLVKEIDKNCNKIKIHFVDFGNYETIDLKNNSNQLRYRIKFDENQEKDLFNMDYQAIKCCYLTNSNDSLKLFIEALQNLDNLESGLMIQVKENVLDKEQEIYVIDFFEACKNKEQIKESIENNVVDTENDAEVLSILEEQEIIKPIARYANQSFMKNTNAPCLNQGSTYEVSVFHIESVNEFYVQTPDQIKILMTCQEKIQAFIESLMASKATKRKQQFKIGDRVLAKYSSDLIWYRGVVTNFKPQLNSFQTGDFFYEVYFVDYGNKQDDLPSSDIYSMQSILKMNEELELNFDQKDIESILNQPYQSFCCELIDKKDNTKNNENLKNLLGNCLNFDIKVMDRTKHLVFKNSEDAFEIIKYSVHLYSEGQLLDDKFEPVEINPKQISPKPAIHTNDEESLNYSNLLKEQLVYECGVSFVDSLNNYIYVVLLDQSDMQIELENLIANDDIISSWKSEPKLGDLVLAKFYIDENNYSWYRSQVIKKNNLKFDIFYFDYGNVASDLTINDLAPLPQKYNLDKYPSLAYQTTVSQLSINDQESLLGEFISENAFKIKIIKAIEPSELDLIRQNKYIVEIWDWDMKRCFNKIIDENNNTTKSEDDLSKQSEEKEQTKIISRSIDKTNFFNLFSENKKTELKIKVKYIFMDNLINPFYFCLKSDLEIRQQLEIEMNSIYSKNDETIEGLDLNSYLAVFSENSWYRAQVKMINQNLIHLFYIDYGYQETIDINTDEKND